MIERAGETGGLGLIQPSLGGVWRRRRFISTSPDLRWWTDGGEIALFEKDVQFISERERGRETEREGIECCRKKGWDDVARELYSKKRGEWHSLVKSHVTLYSWTVCWVNGAPDLLSLFAVQHDGKLTEHIESRLLKSRYRFPAAPLNSACRPHGVWINAPASLMHTLLSIMAPSTSLHQISGSTMQLAHTDQYSSCYVYCIYTSTNSEHFGI